MGVIFGVWNPSLLQLNERNDHGKGAHCWFSTLQVSHECQRSNAGMVSFAATLETFATSGYLEYASKMTRTIWPVGNGPPKYADACNHGPFDVGDIFRGSCWELLVLAWQGMQLALFLSTLLSILGNYSLDCRSCLVLQFRGAFHGRCYWPAPVGFHQIL